VPLLKVEPNAAPASSQPVEPDQRSAGTGPAFIMRGLPLRRSRQSAARLPGFCWPKSACSTAALAENGQCACVADRAPSQRGCGIPARVVHWIPAGTGYDPVELARHSGGISGTPEWNRAACPNPQQLFFQVETRHESYTGDGLERSHRQSSYRDNLAPGVCGPASPSFGRLREFASSFCVIILSALFK
jgi:hypothetical protein